MTTRKWLVCLVLLAGCRDTPITPASPTPPPVVNVPPPVATPPPAPMPTPPPRNPLLDDPRFNLAFYRQFALNGFERPAALEPLRRQTEPPRIYLRTIDNAGRSIDARTLDETAAALINTAGSLTGVFGLAGMERGTDSRVGQRGWITVRWSDDISGRNCAEAFVAGDLITIYYRKDGSCRCAGGGAIKPLIVKHELGHALGYRHTDSLSDLMHNGGHTTCDMQPSAREVFHARVAYSMPIGSLDP